MSHNNVSQKIHKLVAQIAASQSVFQRNIVLQLASEDATRRYSAVWSVFTESVVDAAPVVVELLHDANREVRLAAIAVAGVISFSSHHKPKTEYKSQTLIPPSEFV